MRVNFDKIPAAQKALDQWVICQFEERGDKVTKVPYSPITGARASTTDPSTWCTFEKAHAAYEAGGADAVGFVFTADDPFTGIDFDEITPDVREMVKRLDSYTELSQSGGGLHVIVEGELPPGRRRRGKVEMYDQGRFFVMTGDHVEGTPWAIEERQAELEALHRDVFGKTLEKKKRKREVVPAASGSVSDDEVFRAASNDLKFWRLWAGNADEYDSTSEADLALVRKLCFYTGGDEGQIDRLFRRSGLMREKWDRDDYRESTLARVRDQSEFYSSPGRLIIGGDGQLTGVQAEEPGRPATTFWYFEQKGRGEETTQVVKIDQSGLIDFLAGCGYAKLYELDRKESIFVRAEGKVLERVSAEQIKDHVLQYAAGQPQGVLEALRRGANAYFGSYLLGCLPVVDPPFQRGDADTAFFYFQSGFVRVTATDVEHRPYSALEGYIWRNQIIDRDFRPLEADEVNRGDFRRFRWRAMRQDEERFASLNSTIGYLLHDYKDPAVAKAICYVDEKISDVPSGRAGKSLVGAAVAEMVPAVRIDARNFRFDTTFAFQQVNASTRVVDFNDASKHFPFERMFSLITDGMAVEQKGRDRLSLPFESSPKFLISTNYVLEGQGGSHEDRIFEVEFSDYYNVRHKPVDDFGRRFFGGWDAAEWNRFSNDLMDCVATYLRVGLYRYAHVNLETKKLIQMTSAEFAEFVETVTEPGEEEGDVQFVRRARYEACTVEQAADAVRRAPLEYDKAEEFSAFQMMFPEIEMEQKDFTTYLKTYARMRGWEIAEARRKGGKLRVLWFICDAP